MGFLSWLGKAVVGWLLEQLSQLVQGIVSKIQRNKKIDEQSEEAVKPLKEAESAEEIDKATDSALGG